MKKIFIIATLAMVILSSVCFAQANSYNLGGVWLNMPYDTVINSYGTPTKNLKGYAQMISKVIFYGDSVEIGFLGNKVRYVVTTANNGWQCQNIRVGMNTSDVIKILGDNYTTRARTAEEIPAFMKESGEPFFEYRWSGKMYSWKLHHDESAEAYYNLAVYENGGKVKAVKLYLTTPEN